MKTIPAFKQSFILGRAVVVQNSTNIVTFWSRFEIVLSKFMSRSFLLSYLQLHL